MDEERNLVASVFIPMALVLAVAGAIYAVFSSNPFGDRPVVRDRQSMNVEVLLETDPALVMYSESDGFETEFSTATSIALSADGTVYIGGESRVKAYRTSGAPLGFDISLDENVYALGVSDDNRVFVSTGARIHVYAPEGNHEGTWELPEDDAIIKSIAFRGDDVFTADAGGRTIHQWSRSGEYIRAFGDFIVPSPYLDIDISNEGNLVAVNPGRHRIETFDDGGNLIAWFGSFSMTEPDKFCGCCNPVHFALLPSGDVATSEKGITRVKSYTHEGTFEGYIAGPDQFVDHDFDCISAESCFASGGNDIAVDADGRVYLLGLATGDIRIFTRNAT